MKTEVLMWQSLKTHIPQSRWGELKAGFYAQKQMLKTLHESHCSVFRQDWFGFQPSVWATQQCCWPTFLFYGIRGRNLVYLAALMVARIYCWLRDIALLRQPCFEITKRKRSGIFDLMQPFFLTLKEGPAQPLQGIVHQNLRKVLCITAEKTLTKAKGKKVFAFVT